jgi:hypothetical protein
LLYEHLASWVNRLQRVAALQAAVGENSRMTAIRFISKNLERVLEREIGSPWMRKAVAKEST